MIKTRNIDPHDAAHINTGNRTVIVPPTDIDEYVTAVAASALTAGQNLTLLTVRPNGDACSVFFTVAVGNLDAVFELVGEDHLGVQRRERFSFVASAASQESSYAYRKLIQISVISVSSSTSTIAVGITAGAGQKIGLPVEVTTPTAISGVGPYTGEFVGMMTSAGSWRSLSAIDLRRRTITLGGAYGGANYLFFDLKPKGARP